MTNPASAEHKGLPIEFFPSLAAWTDWLAEHGGASPGLWIKFAKKSAGVQCLSKADAIAAALAWGWIDGQIDRLDENYWLTRFTARTSTSRWSQINRATAGKLIEQGRMTPAGLREVERAKADGRWNAAYAPQSRAEVPADLAAALLAEPAAEAFFATLKGANRYAVLYRIHDAKTPKTRAARIAKFVGMLARGEVLHPPRP